MRYVAVLNSHGGTLRTMDLEAFGARAVEIFTRHGHQLECRVVAGGDIAQALLDAANSPGVEAILAGGGDGTISSAADVAFRKKLPLAVLPAGTMNLFARALKLPLDLEQALEALAGGEVTGIDIATANGRPFVHQFGVGVHARLVRIRETITYRSRLGKMFASLRAIVSTIIRPPDFAVEIHTRRGREQRRASGIAISNNPIGEGHIPYANALDGGVLGVYVAAPMSAWALARLAFDVFRGHWRDSPMVWESELQELLLRFPKRKHNAQAVVDGELIDLAREVVLRVHPGALLVVVPKSETPVAVAA
ncbi:diacylglycerol kinase family protein [Devosia sp.]|uniref:diacylglycerol/lipid kinase family protein n=1 Tax=Devosia sp. TaxID=1871048 RepID=UPI003263F961